VPAVKNPARALCTNSRAFERATVMPAKAGIRAARLWIPTFAAMTNYGVRVELTRKSSYRLLSDSPFACVSTT
jgi:hypothetical protein